MQQKYYRKIQNTRTELDAINACITQCHGGIIRPISQSSHRVVAAYMSFK